MSFILVTIKLVNTQNFIHENTNYPLLSVAGFCSTNFEPDMIRNNKPLTLL